MSDEAPPRLDMDEGVPEMAARALRAARDDVPDDDHLRRVEGLLMARLALSAAGGGGGQGPSGGGNPGASGPPPATGATGAGGATGGAASGISASIIGGGLAIVALVCGGLLASQLSSSGASTPSPEAPVVTAPQVVVTPPSAFVPPTATSEKVVSVDDLPRAATPSATATTTTTVAAPSAPKPGPVDPAEETRLVSDAQKTLRSDPAATLRACNDHARKFPGGALAQERDALAIEALVALGRKPEARTKLETFRAAYPGSGHLRKLDALF